MPYRTRTIHTPLAPPQVEERLRRIVRSRRSFLEDLKDRFNAQGEWVVPFEGTVEPPAFKVSRIIGYKNSFLPVVRGHFQSDIGGGTRIRLRMTLHPATAVFMLIWFGLLGRSLPGLLGRTPNDTDLVILGMIAFGIVLTCAGFYPEAIKAERLIRAAVMPEGTSRTEVS